MTESFSKLSINDTNERDTKGSHRNSFITASDELMHTPNSERPISPVQNKTPTTINSINVKRTSSTSSNYENINANLHARVKAFQEQRALKRSTSIGSNKSEHDSNQNNQNQQVSSPSSVSSGSSVSQQRIQEHVQVQLQQQSQIQPQLQPGKIQQIVNKPLPPLPPTSITTNISSFSSSSSTREEQTMIQNMHLPATIKKDTNKQEISYKNNKHTNLSDQNLPSSLSNYQDTQNSVEKTLESLRNKKIFIEKILRTVQHVEYPNSISQLNPTRRAPRRPLSIAPITASTTNTTSTLGISTNTANVTKTSTVPSSISHHQLPTISSTNTPTIERPKQSLSARRGLKLPLGGMSLKMLNKLPSPSAQQTNNNQQEAFAASPSNKNHSSNLNTSNNGKRSNPGSLINAIQSTATSSSNNEQHDTEGTNPSSSVNSNGSGSGSGSGGIFANFSKYVDIKSGSLNFAGKLSLSSKGIYFNNGSSSKITLEELEFLEEIGHGNYGNVSKVLHKPTNIIMAMKEVRLELDEAKFRQILMELEVLHKCQSPYVVDFYGAFFIEGAVYMCMEYMDGGSLDKIYSQDPEIGGIDEPQLAVITTAVIRGLKVLKDEHNIIHRDVKPTNILCSAKQGTIKLCDFGVSGNLVASMAKTNIGCQSYMAPERIKSFNPDMATYTVQSDIWSLGLSILEMALGRYPYPPETFDNIFSQLSAIVDGPPPQLPSDKFSKEAQDFVSLCLQKIPERRLNYSALLEHPWLVKYRDVDVGMSDYLTSRLEKRKKILAEKGEDSLRKRVPALHMGGL
ncbi:mitogen-activated protein kinase kinase PBS2 NDAI_0G06150 [Naumovozyma dairenensis CBS 421]|uniref:mitogen-activated protein kinase kinase n=1 Tax=Naumovozyma dairenensis (strain ATCC 10597 / BCRC 20456 / CBS 421 / NBRC 0211 / NRRL Y-12639) TaxID=1071378 RepID=J7SB70_NAUDC|nr:hypothetical protein NDAI_0G06150 [Naumovozyma dairenensis CBS 421]CCK73598.1 hypothetical protein NDAI_0G06150 [Naumovozyma dairenensis CBS 421]